MDTPKKPFTDIKKPGEFDGPPDAASVLPEKKQFITPEQFAEIWDTRGMKYRIDELHVSFLNRGLLPSIDRTSFRGLLREILEGFFVYGAARRDPRRSPRARFPKVH